MSTKTRRLSTIDAGAKWSGPTRSYDLVKEFVIAFLVIAVAALTLAGLFSSPDEKAITLQSWSKADPVDFVQTAAGELAGTTTSATYGPPYNTAADGQKILGISPAKLVGVRIPIDPAQSFVIEPLTISPSEQTNAAISTWNSADAHVKSGWANAYADALTKDGKSTVLSDPKNLYGPVPTLVTSLLTMAESGGLDGALTTSDTNLPTNFTKPMLFLADGGRYFPDLASAQHLGGDQWGVMNETGSWPGQSWLWLYSLWYQIDPFKSSENADILVMTLMGILSLLLVGIPLIPWLRKIPIWIPVHRLIWRKWYARSSRE